MSEEKDAAGGVSSNGDAPPKRKPARKRSRG
jgi:hypothetical protein